MASDTVKLTIRLPAEDVEFVKSYARAHHISVTEVIDRGLRRMRVAQPEELLPDIDFITGLIPTDSDAMASYRAHLKGKHR